MNNLVKWRFKLIIIIMLAATLLIVGRYAFLIINNDSEDIRQRHSSVERGKILDRNGKVLASSINLYNVYVSPPEKERIPGLARDLAPFFNISEEEIKDRILKANGNFLLQRQVPLAIVEVIREEQKAGRLRGVSTLPIPSRIYPEKKLASQIIGFVGGSTKGLEGVEYAFDQELSEGSNVTLTLDINVQHILEKVASSTLQETEAESVMFFAMDPRNGEMLGSAVLPDYDPNNYRNFTSDKYTNRSAHELYEPGSVFKVFSIAALMDSGAITENTEFICNGVYEKVFSSGEKVTIECADGHAHGRIRAREIIINSCNVGAAMAADRQENRAFYQSIIDFGFGKKTGTWVNMETAGLLKETNLWSGRSRQSITFGQEIAVSALQMMQAAGVIANNGMLVPPKLISQITSADGKTVTPWVNSINSSRQVIRPDTTRKMLSYMRDTATMIGTGWRANIEDLNLAVKTGTSQYRDPLAGGYSKTDFIASCVALLPAESPSLILYAVIIKPQGESYGGRIAAPAIREAAELLIDYLGIPRGRNPIVEHPGIIGLTDSSLPHVGAHVPSFYGLSKKALLPLLLRDDLHVEIYGEGWVKYQSPPPGTAITADTVIELTLE